MLTAETSAFRGRRAKSRLSSFMLLLLSMTSTLGFPHMAGMMLGPEATPTLGALGCHRADSSSPRCQRNPNLGGLLRCGIRHEYLYCTYCTTGKRLSYGTVADIYCAVDAKYRLRTYLSERAKLLRKIPRHQKKQMSTPILIGNCTCRAGGGELT